MIIPILLATIITGNTSTSTKVTTSVSGDDAIVETNITSEINGKKVTVTRNEPGTVEVKQENDTTSVTVNGVPVTPTITITSPNPTAYQQQLPATSEPWIVTSIRRILSRFRSFFRKPS